MSAISKSKLLVAALSILLLAACSSTPTPGPNPGKIIQGSGVEEVKIGDSMDTAAKALGEPDTLSKNPFNSNNTIAEYYSKGLELSFDSGSLGSIVIYPTGGKWTGYQGSTKEGAWPGQTPKEVKKLLGTPTKELPRALIYQGLWIRITEQGTVESFSIGG